jgi:hypothetical protein
MRKGSYFQIELLDQCRDFSGLEAFHRRVVDGAAVRGAGQNSAALADGFSDGRRAN